jgi:ArsR family transcriptional regulator, arsenate/arsenite/antimonite-responsive transcriptional repressor
VTKTSDARSTLRPGFYISTIMEMSRDTLAALEALSSLAQHTRLEVFRLLIAAGPEGLAAGDIAQRLGMPPSSLSFHLAHLLRSGLLVRRRAVRAQYYSANFQRMQGLIDFLTYNCCGGKGCSLQDWEVRDVG